jgi:hypothetical protein
MKRETYHEETGLEGYFPGREKQDVFPAAPAAPIYGWVHGGPERTLPIPAPKQKRASLHE